MMKAPTVARGGGDAVRVAAARPRRELSSEQQAAEVAAERALRLQAAMARARAVAARLHAAAAGSARLHHFVELVAAKGFGPTPLYIEYYAWAAPGWRLLTGGSPARAITQVAAPRGASGRAVLGFPIELAVESEGAPVSKRPPLTVFSGDVDRRVAAPQGARVHVPRAAADGGDQGEEVRCWKVGVAIARARRLLRRRLRSDHRQRALAIPDGHVRRAPPRPPASAPRPPRPAPRPPRPSPSRARRTAPSSRSTASTPSPPGCSSSRRRPSSSRRRRWRSLRRSAPPPPLPRRRPRRGRRPRGRRCRCARSRSSGRRRRRATACASGSRAPEVEGRVRPSAPTRAGGAPAAADGADENRKTPPDERKKERALKELTKELG